MWRHPFRRRASVEPSASASSDATPAPTALPSTESQADPGDVIIRWYCCLGTGDAPEQVEVERKVAEDFNASHPGIHLQFEGIRLRRRARRAGGPAGRPVPVPTSSARSASVAPRRSTASGSTSSRTSTRPASTCRSSRESTVDLYNAGGEGQLGIPYAIYPSVLFYKADMFKEAGLDEPPHTWNAEYTMPDGSKRPWDYDTVREIAKILTVDENGADATEAGFDPEKIVQWGFEPQRDDLRQTGAYFGAGSFMASGRQDRPDAGAVGRRVEAFLRRHLDRPFQHDRPEVRDDRPQPGRATRSAPARSR